MKNKYPRYFIHSDNIITKKEVEMGYKYDELYILVDNTEYIHIENGKKQYYYNMENFFIWMKDEEFSQEISKAEAALRM